MKKKIFALLSTLALLSSFAFADGLRTFTTATANPDISINQARTGIAYHKLTWTTSGTVSSCTVALDSSVDNVTWTPGGVITGQTCTTPGAAAIVNATVNYVRINVTTITGGGTVSATWNGYVNNPLGGGVSVTGTPTVGHCTSFASTTSIQDAGGVCGGAGSAPGGSSTAFQINTTGTFGGTTLTDLAYSGHTITLGSTGILDTSAASVAAGLKIPSAAGAAPTADGFSAFNTTSHLPVWGSNSATVTIPQNTTSTASNWLNAYNSATGAYTKSQPNFTDLAGSVALAQTPLTTNGDLLTVSGSALARLAVTNNANLVSASSLPAWGPAMSTAGDIQYFTSSAFARLAGNTSGTACLQENASGVPTWGTCAPTGTLGYTLTGTGTASTFTPLGIDASQFAGTSTHDACDKTAQATATINGNSSPAVDSRAFIGTAIGCAVNPIPTTFSGRWYAPAGALQLNNTSIIFGGSVEVEGVSTGTSQVNGSLLQALNGSWSSGLGGNFAPGGGLTAGTFASPPAWSSGSTYNWGYGVSNGGSNYYAVADGLFGGPHTPGTDWLGWTLLNNVPSPVIQPLANLRNSIQGTAFHNITLDCQFTAGTPGTMTDGCDGLNNLSAQELFVLDRVPIRNPTVAGINMQDFVPNAGPFSGQVVYSAPTAGQDQVACKVNTADATNKGAQSQAISTITVTGSGSNTLATVTLTAPTSGFSVYNTGLVDIINSSAAFSPYAAGVVDELSNTHGFWQVWSVESSSVFTIKVPNGTTSCASTCGTAYFFPIGITVSSNSAQNERGFDSWTLNGSNCPSTSGSLNTAYSAYMPLGFQVAGGDIPFRNVHSEGHRVAGCVGCFGVSDGEQIVNFWPNVNTHTGLLISNQFGNVTNLDIENMRCNISGGGHTGNIVDCLVDLPNHNTITLADNLVIGYYRTDGSGFPYALMSQCSDMTNGWCDDGSNRVLKLSGSVVFSVSDATGNVTAPVHNATTGFEVNGAAPTGHLLVGNGTNYVDGGATCATCDISFSVLAAGTNSNAGTFAGSGNTWDFSAAGHTLPALVGAAASKPATCKVGEMYFANDATAGQNWYYCTTTNVWTQQLNSGAGGANTALSNLSAVAVNASLVPGSDAGIDLGSASLRWRNEYISNVLAWTNGSGTADTGVCRGAAGQVDVSNGTTCNASGNLVASGIATGSATVPSFNGITLPTIVAPSAPSAGTQNIWVDSTDLRLHDEGNAATIGTTVVAKANVSHQWFSSMSAAGVFTSTQPASTDLSDTANLVYNNNTNAGTSAMTLNMSASTTADSLRAPVKAGATAAATGSFEEDSTAKNYHIFANGADAIVGAFSAAPTTGDVVSATVSASNVLLSDAGYLASNVVTDSGTATSNVLMKGAGSKAVQTGDVQDASNVLSNVTSTQSTTYKGGTDAAANSVLGNVIVTGANETGAGGATSAGGGALLEGGTNAATNAASAGGSTEILAGASTGGTQGLQGLNFIGDVYVKAATSTLWDLACPSAAMTVKNCGAGPTNWVGVIEAVNSNTDVVLSPPGYAPINASAAVTLNDTVCAGGTGGQVTDSGGTASCTNAQGATVGVVMATAGTWTLPDGTSFTATTTLPLVKMTTAVQLTTSGGGSGTVSSCATTGALADYTGSTTVGCGNADFTYATDTLTGGASGLLDLSAITSTSGFKVPLKAGDTAGAAGVITFDSTNKNYHGFVNSADSIFLNIAAAPTTGDVASYTVAAGNTLAADAGFLATNVVRKDTTNAGAAAMTLDMSAATGATAFKVPVIAGATAGADGVIDYDSTAKITHVRTNGADSDVAATTATSTTTTQALFATAVAGVYNPRAVAIGDLPSIPINDVVSATGAIATIADGNNPLVVNCALTSGTTCLTTGETTAATTAGAVEHQITTLTTTTAIPLQITQGAAGPANAAAPNVLNISAAAAGGASGASNAGSAGAAIGLLTGAGSAGGATTGNGGAGGAFTITEGAGGAGGGTTTNNGGAGGGVAWTTGAGGAAAATGTSGSGGNAVFTMGVGGTTGTTPGSTGEFEVTGTAPASQSTIAGLNVGTLFGVLGVAGGATTHATSAGGIGSNVSVLAGAGGAGNTSGAGGAGGTITATTGAGGTPGTTGAGGAGGAMTVSTGVGAAGGATSGTGGNGGALGITAGAGGAQATSGNGGAGGSVTITGGAGGNGATTGGAGGNIILTPGAVGTGGAPTAGAVQITAGQLQIGAPAAFTLGTAGADILGEGTAFTGQSGYDGSYANSTNHCLDIINQTTDVGCAAAASNTLTMTNKTLTSPVVTTPAVSGGTVIGTAIANSTIANSTISTSPAIQTPLSAIGIFNPTALPVTFANSTQSLTVGTQYGPPGIDDKSIGVTTAAMGAQTSATCTNVTGMSWPIQANKNYLLRCEVPMTLAATATIQYCLGGPGTATSYSLTAEGDLGTAGIWSQVSTLAQTAYSTKTNASAAVAATSVQHVWAQIQNGSTASGIPLTLQTAANGTNAITVLANASCTLTQEN